MSTVRRPKRVGGWLLSLAVLAAGAVGVVATRTKPPLEVWVEPVARGEVRELVAGAAAGRVEPAQRVSLRAEIAATVAERRVARGARVDKGQLLILFQSDELEARLTQAQANLDAARVSIKMAASRQSAAQKAKDRAEKLRQGGAISEAELERATTELDAAGLALAQSEATLKQSQAALKLAQVAADRAKLLAPFAGVVQDVFVDVGVQVAPGAALLDLIDDGSVFVEVPVDEADIARVSVGQVAFISSHGAREEAITGRVRFIPPAVGRSEAASPTRLAAAPGSDRSVYLEVAPDSPERLRIGASVNVEILVRSKPDVLFVPSQAVMGRGARREVYLLSGGRVEKQSFEAGLTSWERTEVVSGLSEGQAVVTRLDTPGLDGRPRAVAAPRGPAPPRADDDPR